MASILTKLRNMRRGASSVSGIPVSQINREKHWKEMFQDKKKSKPGLPSGTAGFQKGPHKLFTPGPLMVTDRVKKAMLQDMGTKHSDFTYVTQCVRQALLQIAQVDASSHTVIPLNGDCTTATEAIIRTIVPQNRGKILVMTNGIQGQQIANICEVSKVNFETIPVDLGVLEQAVESGNNVIGVIVVHCDTSSGAINPVDEIGETIKKVQPECLYFVDGTSTFGGIPINMNNVDFLVSTANRCLQGVPGLSFIIANKKQLEKHRGNNAGLVLDLADQYDELERTGHFRFTPPTHVMLAFKEAVLEYLDEGGLTARAKRFQGNTEVLKTGMKEMGFKQVIENEDNNNSYIVTSYHYPTHPLFSFDVFYRRLCDSGHIICSKSNNPNNDSFCIGSIGNIGANDMKHLLAGIRQVCLEMGMKLPLDHEPL